MNWSLIQNKELFYTHLFQYKPGVDDGPIAGVQTFDITPHDTCHTLHFKNVAAMVQLCARLLPELLSGTAQLVPQPQGQATYYPKREAEDGLIYWDDNTVEIYNLIRAVTRPFPGAFAFLDNDPSRKILLWRAIPFDTRLRWPRAVPGEIVEVFYDGSLVVKTRDSSLLVLDSEGWIFAERDIGRRFGTSGIPRKVWTGLPE
jgi:methionyl-tRNA formyltransferase